MTGYQLSVGHAGETASSHNILNRRSTWKRVACPGGFRDDTLIVRGVECIRADDPRVEILPTASQLRLLEGGMSPPTL